MQMDEGMDTGDMLLPASIAMDKDETAGSLFVKLAELGAETLLEALSRLRNNELVPTKQDDDDATTAPPLKKEMGLVDWSKSAEELHCLVRGLDPWPSAYTFLEGTRYRLFAPEVVHKDSDAPDGTILLADRNGILVATGSNSLLIRELQPEGKKRLTAEAYLNGHPIPANSRFTNTPES